ncbi:sulfate adenylyltransferase subunit CysD [Candidatus Nomurabacteria bacterium]|nr:sulfate adenylyltransferase subunit CysD [Candidatus Nomurabacteria bacterium]
MDVSKYNLDYLDQLEAESMHIFRESAATFQKPVLLYSIGKDSSVLLHLALKAFAPGKLPFPLLHVNTGFKFDEMIEFRDKIADQYGLQLFEEQNTEPKAMEFTAEDANSEQYIYYKKTKPLVEGLKKHGFDAAFGGARRDEEKARAKERIFSHRDKDNVWKPRAQRPELWHLYNPLLKSGESMRVFPLSNWTELDIWMYIKRENIDIVPLYFAKKRDVVVRNGVILRVDEFVKPKEGEEVIQMDCRYRTLGCSPSTGAVPSTATTLDEVIDEVFNAACSERENRMIDKNSDSSMEQKKKEGYF